MFPSKINIVAYVTVEHCRICEITNFKPRSAIPRIIEVVWVGKVESLFQNDTAQSVMIVRLIMKEFFKRHRICGIPCHWFRFQIECRLQVSLMTMTRFTAEQKPDKPNFDSCRLPRFNQLIE